MLAYDEFYAKYPEGEINKEQFMEVSKVQPFFYDHDADDADHDTDDDYADFDDYDDIVDDYEEMRVDNAGWLPCRVSIPSL